MHIPSNLPLKVIPEIQGDIHDFNVLLDDKWLINSEVQYWIQERKSQWVLTMVFIAVDNPYKLVCKRIDVYFSEKKAITFAKILQRGIRKDARGILKTNFNAFNFCNN